MSFVKESALRLVLKAKDTLSQTVLKSATTLESLRKEAQTLKKKLSDLQKQDRLLSSFQKQTAAVRDAGKAYRDAEVRIERLAREFQRAEKPSRSLQHSLESARKTVVSASRAYQTQHQKLAGLNSAIEQAEAGMERLADTTRGTLEGLQDELDRLQGKQDDIDQRRFEARKQELETQLTLAKQQGDNESISNLKKALSLNQSIYTETKTKRKQQEQAAARREREEQARQEKSRSQRLSTQAPASPKQGNPR